MSNQEEYLLERYSNETALPMRMEGIEAVASKMLFIYVCPLFLFLGTLWNFQSFFILYRMSHRVWSTCLYLSMLSLVDILVLYVECGNNWLKNMVHYDLSVAIMLTSNTICKVYPFVYNFILHFSSWIHVALVTECFISVRYPLLTHRRCKRETAQAVMLFITVLLFAINIHFFWTYGLTLPKHSNIPFAVCTYVNELSDLFRDTIWQIMDFLVGSVMPVTFVLLLLVLTAIYWKNFKKQRNACNEVLQRHFMNIDSLHELKKTAIIIGILYSVVTLPKIAMTTFSHLLITYNLLPFSMKLVNQVTLAKTSQSMFFYAYLSCKFIIFYATSTHFRKEVKCLRLQLCKICNKKGKVTLNNGRCMQDKPLIEGNNVDKYVHRSDTETNEHPVSQSTCTTV